MIEAKLISWFVEKLNVNRVRSDSFSLLAKLTVVIPSFNRHEYLMRSIIYWARSSVRVIIVDGSDEPLQENIQSVIQLLHNISYIHKKGSMALRLNEASKHLVTDYAVMMGDDEFLLETGLQAALVALEHQPDVIGCIGQSIIFNSAGISVSYGMGYPHKDYHVVQENVAERVQFAMMQYNAATCYAVLRRSCWIRSYGNIKEWSSPYAGEIQQALITYICGKFISVNSLYWWRSFDEPPVHNSNFNRKLSFQDWWADKRFIDERRKFVGLIVDELLKSDDISYDRAHEIANLAIETYLNFCEEQKSAAADTNNKAGSFMRAFIRRFVSENAIIFIKKLLGRPASVIGYMEFEYGTLDEFVERNLVSSYGLSKDMTDEMKLVDMLIAEFNQVIACSNT